MGRTMATSRGLTALFQGQPGTGKTMVAGVIARELGLDLYQVDLSKVMSKWIGETESNLAAIFDAAEDGQVVLLFDEADSLFAKRTEVRSSNDRYANLEVNYLLQRLDTFEGIAILTTNFGGSIDPAFKRRLSFRLSFPFPDEDTREQLWRAHLPPRAADRRAARARRARAQVPAVGRLHPQRVPARGVPRRAGRDRARTSTTSSAPSRSSSPSSASCRTAAPSIERASLDDPRDAITHTTSARRPTASRDHDDDLSPGRQSRTAQLDAPERTPLPSGLVQRKARDDNGVADGAEAAVATPPASTGSTLPDDRCSASSRRRSAPTCRRCASTPVRESATAAHAVGARAYTVGQDIHFGAGQYDPSSAAGQHLLAHEVAHTVQQRGGTPTRQNKLEVSAPHDAAELEADRAADAMVRGAASAVIAGSETAATARSDNPPIRSADSEGIGRRSNAAIGRGQVRSRQRSRSLGQNGTATCYRSKPSDSMRVKDALGTTDEPSMSEQGLSFHDPAALGVQGQGLQGCRTATRGDRRMATYAGTALTPRHRERAAAGDEIDESEGPWLRSTGHESAESQAQRGATWTRAARDASGVTKKVEVMIKGASAASRARPTAKS